MALQISKQVRPRLDLEQESWFIPGKVRLPDVRAARLLAWRVNEALGESERERAGVSGGAMRALDLIEEALQRIARHYLKTRDPSLIRHAREGLAATLGQASLDETLKEFNEEYLGGSPISSDEAVLELLILWILHNNPAARSITRVLHESPLLERPQFQQAVESLTGLLEAEELPATAGGERLLDLLLGPQRASPDSLLGQLQFLLRQWGELLADYRSELQAGLDLFAEELAPRFGGGPGPAEAPVLSFGDDDQVRYSSDRNWMPSLVLLAKNVYVWLDQLSKRYGTPMRHLDEIPDAELAGIAARGISGLWLIGVWERSIASQRVKQMCGNPEAVASAYSLRRYKIADELGGEAALQRLEKKAWDHGVRLAADMVPNHMGIDSDWVLEHPDWFLGGTECPFPSYSFDGPDFSPDPSVGIYLEDHYFDRSDAAVVFKRVDHGTGEARFIYHGNDGTSMPWNDTAQLDYLDPRVREAVLENILDVARRFPVIRFDAAMTLTKRHYQRLWFPEPGTAGAIPSRAERGMTREAFNHRMPEEFWREVVDRVSAELPDTLLLAEAFWLMEGYFVRTLGMHRVYNSAFMNMLRDQENDKYRRLLKETLEFDPQILQRYVNFMSNPDEQTAVDQFGKEDRYFGVCVLMATLPGLPMFAHGQFEGFAEKYGMEYRRAYWGEEADAGLIARHEREIVPLLKRRQLFAGVGNFRLYDVIDDGGGVNEDVYALSNGVGDDQVLVLFNNRYQHAHGRVHLAAPMSMQAASVPAGEFRQSLAGALGLDATHGAFIGFRDLIGELEFLIDSHELVDSGLPIDLGAFHYRVLADFRPLRDDPQGLYARLADRLAGTGVESLEQARRGLQLEPLRDSWQRRIYPALTDAHSIVGSRKAPSKTQSERLSAMQSALGDLAVEAARIGGGSVEQETLDQAGLRLQTLRGVSRATSSRKAPKEPFDLVSAALVWIVLQVLVDALGEDFAAPTLLEEWSLRPEVTRSLAEMGIEPEVSGPLLASIACSIELDWGRQARPAPDSATLLSGMLADQGARRALNIHSFEGIEYLNREALETMLCWRRFLETWAWSVRAATADQEFDSESAAWKKTIDAIEQSASKAGYRTDRLRQHLAKLKSESSS